jgi:tetratricopeptide (TPR) repeat protein
MQAEARRRALRSHAPARARASREWIAWLAVAALALAVRLLHLWEIRRAPIVNQLVGDGRAYDAWARQIAAGDWVGSGVFYQAPLYPYFLAAIYALRGHDLAAVRVVQALLGATACVLLGAAGQRFFCRQVGLLAGVMLALWPSAFFADALIQKSALDTVLLCGLLALLATAVRRPAALTWFATGVILGGLALTRENALAFAPVLLVVIAARFRAGGWARAAASLLLGLVLMLLPVSVRNWSVGGEFHLTTAQFGPNFYIGNNPAATGIYQPLRYGRGDPRYERLDATELAEAAVGRALTPGEVSGYWSGRAFEFIARQPRRWLGLLARKGVLFVNRIEVGDAEDPYTYAEWSWPLALLGRLLHYGVLVPLAAAGVVLTWPRRRAIAVLLALLLVYAATVVATFVMARYRHPALPLLILFAAAALVEGVRHVRARRWRLLLVAAGVAAAAAVPANWPVVAESSVRAGSLYNIARNLEDQPGGLDQAIEYYRQSLALEPNSALAHSNLGAALQRRGQLADALAEFRRAIELQPGRGEYHYNLAGGLAAAGDGAGAAASYQRALALDPNDADARNNLGVLLQQRGDLSGAEQQYAAALTRAPRHVGVLSNLGALYAQQGKLDLAIQSFQSALAVEAQARSARENLALALAQVGRTDEAAREYDILVRAEPNDVPLRCRTAALLSAAGRRDEAIAHLRAALRIAPDSADARSQLDQLLGTGGSPLPQGEGQGEGMK